MYREELVGAAYLLGNIYIVVKGCCNVLVHSGHSPYEMTGKIPVDGMEAVDIATSYIDICVYVLDNGNGRVSRIGQNHDVGTAIDGLRRGNLLSMSVAKGGRIIIVEEASLVRTYTKDGILAVSDRSMYEPFKQCVLHAVEVASDFIVCTDSHVTKRTRAGTTDLRLLHADNAIGCRYITIDRDGNPIVCDCVRHRVIQLDSESLKVTDTLLTLEQDGIQNPQHVQYVLDKKPSCR